jgi:hypothetical protein
MSVGKPASGQDMTNGDNGDLLGEINSLIHEDKLETEAALRLMLKSQQRILRRTEEVERISRENRDYSQRYPSLAWLWMHRRRTTIITIFLAWLALYILFSTVTIADFRHFLLELVGGIP